MRKLASPFGEIAPITCFVLVETKCNTGYEHKILLGEADAYSSLPMLPDKIEVRCDGCGEEYSYKQKEIMRDEIQIPETFVPHPLFKFS